MANKNFTIDNYNEKSCFSSFFPGISGKEGIPIWVFYVNRGQSIAAFGIENKENSIIKFKPADQSYSETPLKGFRTFLKVNGKNYEPFSTLKGKYKVRNKMNIRRNYLELEEVNEELNIKVNVEYTTLPNEQFGGLIRRVKISNLDADNNILIEVLDGLPEIIPYGVTNTLYNEMGYTARAWMEVFNLEHKIPYYKTRTSIKDSESVEEIEGGYYFISSSSNEILENIYDKDIIFGNNVDLQEPENFYSSNLESIMKKDQNNVNLLPCGFSTLSKELSKNSEITINTMIGFCSSIEKINDKKNILSSDSYYELKIKESESIVEDIVKNIHTETSNYLFDEYIKQNYLDNILRGGLPLIFGKDKDTKVYHIYSRKHGDLERDYNFFELEGRKYSQGNGNFRDVLQNRRNDIIFNPDIKDFNIKMFFNLVQIDGGNPLVVKGLKFKLKREYFNDILESFDDLSKDKKNKLLNIFSEKFTPGDLLFNLEKNNININIETSIFLEKILNFSEVYEEADYKEGFWIDHWTYLMDLIDTYLEIYPEKEKELLFNSNDYKYYNNFARVKPRYQKYKIRNGGISQLDSVFEDKEKLKKISQVGHFYLTDTDGNVYTTNLFEKLLSLFTMKFLNLDPEGMGISMDANKPGWNDALNGLPSMFGSGMSETFELKKILIYILSTKEKMETNVSLNENLIDLLEKIEKLLDDEALNNIEYWNKSEDIKEEYIIKVIDNLSGNKHLLPKSKVFGILEKMKVKIDNGIERSKCMFDGLYPTYFTYDIEKYTIDEYDRIKIDKVVQHTLPLFLEGNTRAMKILSESDKLKIYNKIKKSNIYDTKLNMYKTSESILSEPHKIGRIRSFTPGWLENESIFMHMEYKYLLEMIKSNKLIDNFYEDLNTTMPPFLDFKVYGRPLTENSSFIVSSVNPDKKVHGKGFSARLSGSTAEFLSMWKYMFLGNNLFRYEEGKLKLIFEPKLHKSMFNREGIIKFKLFSEIDVTYINKTNRSTYGVDRANVDKILLICKNGEKIESGAVLEDKIALMVRNRQISSIEIYFI